MASSTNNRLLLNYHDAVLYESDLALLESPTAWLNDACMNFAMTRLGQKFSQQVVLDPAVVAFFVHQCVDEDEIQEFMQGNPQLQTSDLIFIPINNGHAPSNTWHKQRGTHWSLLVIVRNDHGLVRYLHFDSVSGSNACTAQAVAENFSRIFKPQSNNVVVVECKTPQQSNGYDCGLHVVASAQVLATMDDVNEDSLNEIQQTDMFELRKTLAADAVKLAKEYSSSS
jgi:sentrin-specific protease 8